MKKIITLIVAAFVAAGLAGCGEQLINISVTVPDVALAVGTTSPIEVAKEFNKDMTDEKMSELTEVAGITFASSDNAVVTVDNETISAVSPGEADVTVTAGELSARVHVSVIQPLENIDVTEELILSLNTDPEGILQVAINPTGADVAILYESSDPSVATVKDGKVTAVAEGEAVITTTVTGQDVADGKIVEVVKTAKTEVSVSYTAESIRLEQGAEGILYVGGTVKLVPRTVPAEAPASTYVFQSSDEKIASVADDGTVTVNATGSATITVTSAEGLTTEYRLVVQAKPTAATRGNTSGIGGNRTPSGSNAGNAGNSGNTGGNTGGAGTATPSTPAPEQPSAPAPAPDPMPAPVPDPSDIGGTPVPYDPEAPNVGGGERV